MYRGARDPVHGEQASLLTITQMGEDAITQRDGLKLVTLARGCASDTFADALAAGRREDVELPR